MLITLGVIGVVAAITMPALINNIQDKQFKTAFKKQYSVISQALQRIYAEDGEALNMADFTQENWTEMDHHVCRITKELKAVKAGLNCSDMTVNESLIWHKNYEWFNKKHEGQALNYGYIGRIFLLADGTLLNFNCGSNIYIDVNGYKGPNTIGRDIFYAQLSQANTMALKYTFPSYTNGCSGSMNVILTKDNYEEDCKNGSGWGCSLLYILE